MTMDEDNSKTSWVRRTNFSHTVCHRLDSMRLGLMPMSFRPAIDEELKLRSSISDASKLASVSLPVGRGAGLKSGSRSPSMPLLAPPALEHDGDTVLKRTMDTSSVKGSTAGTKSGPPVRAQLEADPKSSRSGTLGSAKLYHDPHKSSRSGPLVRAKMDPDRSKSTSSVSRRERNSMSKQRSLSPLPRIALSDTFKEARAEGKRYSTPPPSRRGSDKSVFGRFFSREASGHHTFNFPSPTETNPIKLFSSTKASDKLKNRKDTPWARYFDHGGRVTAVETTEEWMVDLSQLYLGLRFASGAHSRLYHGIYKDQPVAVKLIRQPDDDDENGELATRLEKQFTREVTHLSHLYHRNVIKLVAACRNPPVFCVITEYLSGGSLRAFLHKLEHKSLPLPKLLAIALDIARGMEYINSQGVIHRDLKPENIIFDQDFCVKIADFGIACEEAYCDLLAEDPGTYRWMAPEMIKHKPYGRKVDVYSFGLLLWEMVTGIIPYEDMTPIQAAFAVVNKNIRPVIPTNCPAALRALIEQCWALLPEKRPEFWQIVKVLEQFETALSQHGTLDLVQNLMCHEHKKWLANWTQKKLKPLHTDGLVQLAPKFL